MKRQSLEFALEQLKPSDWKRFEEFASEFLTSDFPNLRTVASPSGDRGRDSEIFSPEGEPSVLLQYSVTSEWEQKIRTTAQRVHKEFPNATVLIYSTNHKIGAHGDKLKRTLRTKYGLALDIRDREWFLDRRSSTRQTENASESLIADVVEPIAAARDILKGKALGLSDVESRAALVYLKLQWEDDTREKGLTKLCFEALVRSVLRNTDSANRRTRGEVRAGVRHILNTHPPGQVDIYTDAALNRLTKKYIRHWKQDDEFCLTHQERIRLLDRLTELDASDRELQEKLHDLAQRASRKLRLSLSSAQIDELSNRVKRIVERLLLSRGEIFVNSIKTGNIELDPGDVKNLAIQDLGDHPDTFRIGASLIDLAMEATAHLLESPDEVPQRYLRSLSDAYTLMAFLRETPDVQSVITKMFSEGTVWLDANIILPLLAETLLEGGGSFHKMITAANSLGLKLRVTSGVIEELERHTNRCLAFVRSHGLDWQGRIPFLVNMYAATGRSLASFGSWLEVFRGERRPAEDIAEYLQDAFGIETDDFDMAAADDELRVEVQEIFYAAKAKSERVESGEIDPISLRRLVVHDTENYVGVVTRRRKKKSSPFGYSDWWLTLDKIAFTVGRQLRGRLKSSIPDSPVLSPDFLINYIALGPRRSRLPKATESRLPLSIGTGAVDYMPTELLTLAEQIRHEMSNLPEHVIRRRVRDELDAAKERRGAVASGGLLEVEEELLRSLANERAQRTLN